MHTIAEVLASDSRPSWQESVALIQEIAYHLAPGQPVPAPDDLLLAEDGTLSFGFAGESSQGQVTDLAGLLLALLTGSTAPQPLIDLAHENARPEPAHSKLEGFSKALAFYERPNRRSDLAAVAGRLAARAQSDRERELLAQLREKAMAEPDAREPETVRPRSVARRVPARQILIAGGVLLTVLMAGAALRSGMLTGATVAAGADTVRAEAAPAAPVAAAAGTRGSGGATSELTPATDRRPEPGPASDRGAAPKLPPAAPAPSISRTQVPRESMTQPPLAREAHTEPHAVATLSSRPPPSAVRASSPPVKLAAPRPAAGPPDRPPASTREAIVPPLPLPLPAPRGTPPQARAGLTDVFGVRGGLSDGGPVYSREDPEVTPPRILRQQLPSVPAPNALTGYLEFVVDTQGNVESLNLISPTTRFHELMLISAAKAWKFRPALFDGRPVKYRIKVPITLDGPSK